jgi:carbon monoxide dehydrogenase subunit G
MILEGTYTFPAPRATVYELLHDPGVLAKALPGAKSLKQVSDESYEGVMSLSVGPVTAAEFAVTVALFDQTPPDRFSMRIDGKGTVGFARGTATISIGDHESGCVMNYRADLQIGGKLAAVGQRLLDSTSKMMTRQALESLARELEARLQPASVAVTPEPSRTIRVDRYLAFGLAAILVLVGVGYCVGVRP